MSTSMPKPGDLFVYKDVQWSRFPDVVQFRAAWVHAVRDDGSWTWHSLLGFAEQKAEPGVARWLCAPRGFDDLAALDALTEHGDSFRTLEDARAFLRQFCSFAPVLGG